MKFCKPKFEMPAPAEDADLELSDANAKQFDSSGKRQIDESDDEPFVTEFHFRASSVSPGTLQNSKGVR